MISKEKIKTLLENLTNDQKNNYTLIRNLFGNIDYKDEEDQSLLHIFVDELYDEDKCFLAIQTLLTTHLSPNLTAYNNYNFIQTALYAGYSENFILKIIEEALKHKLNINHVDSDGDTIMHTAIYSDDYHEGIEKIYTLLCNNGFDSTIKDKEGRNLIEAMNYQNTQNKKYSNEQIESFKQLFLKQLEKYPNKNIQKYGYSDYNNINSIKLSKITKESYNKPNQNYTPKQTKTCEKNISISSKTIENLEKFGRVLNNKKYLTPPTIGRESELKKLILIIATEKKNPLLVGESGVGKTAIAEELAYRIINGEVPNFLKDKIILEINPNDIVAGTPYVGQFEERMKELTNLCLEHNVIIFIDEIHTTFGVGSTKDKNNDLISILKHYMDRTNLKVIGTTTTEKYQEFLSRNDIKRRFETIEVKEPSKEILHQILHKILGDYFIKYGISIESNKDAKIIVDTLISLTEKKHRTYNDIANNPDLAISILDRAYAIARVNNSNYLTIEHLIESIEYCDRIYDSVKKDIIKKIYNQENKQTKTYSKILQFNPKKY